jgi:hypothetical protein
MEGISTHHHEVMMNDKPIWDTIAAVRSLLELVPDDPSMHCRLDDCIKWVGQTVERDVYGVDPSKNSGDSITTAVPPDSPLQLTKLPSFPAERDRRGESLWWTDYPWRVINDTLSTLRPVLPEILAELPMDEKLKHRIARDFAASSGFLEEDYRGTIWGFLGADEPVDERMRSRNNGRLDALGVFLGAIRAHPEIILEAVSKLVSRAKASLEGWSFDIKRGRIEHRGHIMDGLEPEAVLFVQMVVEASPGYVKFDELKPLADREGIEISATKLAHLRKRLPAHIVALLEIKPGTGTRLKD